MIDIKASLMQDSSAKADSCTVGICGGRGGVRLGDASSFGDATTEGRYSSFSGRGASARVVAEEATEKVMVPTDRGMESAVVAMVKGGEVEAMVLTEGEMEAMEEVMVPRRGKWSRRGEGGNGGRYGGGNGCNGGGYSFQQRGKCNNGGGYGSVVAGNGSNRAGSYSGLTEVLATVTKMA
ncbi:glycine-rich RNA-binding protein 1-like [Penaeus monodon]|uniref:glycine-rich RNA-binding protein 1-like n=1 Tax=Penaeus monodon TaxID=6687 RepID=UPI0018A7BAB2|nr:glycine-rich RNA-binding protein 1-like [Penaeus monodon]